MIVVTAVAGAVYFYHRVDEGIRHQVEVMLTKRYPHLDVTVRSARLLELEGFEINVRAGNALVIQSLKSVPDNPDRATANNSKSEIITFTTTTGGGLAYHYDTDLVFDIGITQYGPDISLAHAGLRYHF